MIIEAMQLINLPVYENKLRLKVGDVDSIVFDKEKLGIVGFEIASGKMIKHPLALDFNDAIQINREGILVKNKESLRTDMKRFDELLTNVGKILGVKARTESKKTLGKVTDLYIEVETGRIVRFHLTNFLKEQIIPRQFVVAVTPKAIIFKDVVAEPLFDQEALAIEATPAT